MKMSNWWIRILVMMLSAGIAVSDRGFLFRFFQYFDQVTDQLSPQCVSVWHYISRHHDEYWVARMLDSNAVQEPGLATGNLQFLGSFDECLDLRIPESTSNLSKVTSSMQYCTVQFPVNLIINQSLNIPPSILAMVPPTAGLCLPSACQSESDLKILLDKFNQMNNLTNFGVQEMQCIKQDQLTFESRVQPEHIGILIMFSILVLFCLLGTFFETIIEKENESNWMIRAMLCFGLKRNLAFLFRFSAPPSRVMVTLTTQPAASELKESSGDVSSSEKTGDSEAPSPSPSPSPPKKMRAPQVDCLHGIRVLSFLFILIYHTFTEAQVPSANILQIVNAERGFLKQLVTNATLWVDTFFLLSGFLVAHSLLYKPPDSIRDHLTGHPKRILHRYLRLTPSVAGVLSLSILIEVLGSGPLWYQYLMESKLTCHRNWWDLFLYINNFCNINQLNQPPTECLGYLWYLAVDMHFFIISPFLVMFLTSPSRRTQTIGVLINIAISAVSWIITAVLMSVDNLTPTVLVTVYDLPYINEVYKASYCRIAPYCLGILLAFYLRRRMLSEQSQYLVPNSQRVQRYPTKGGSYRIGILLLTVSVALMLTITLLTYPWLVDKQSTFHVNAWSVIYGTTHRTIWALAWALFIWACVRGHVPVVNQIFSLSLFQFLSKLTYQCYLLHSVLIAAVTKSVRQKIYYSTLNLVLDVFRYFILTVLTSISTFVLFERPFLNLELAFLK